MLSSYFFFFLAVQSGMQNLSSRQVIELVSPEVEAWSLNHWTTREVPFVFCFFF